MQLYCNKLSLSNLNCCARCTSDLKFRDPKSDQNQHNTRVSSWSSLTVTASGLRLAARDSATATSVAGMIWSGLAAKRIPLLLQGAVNQAAEKLTQPLGEAPYCQLLTALSQRCRAQLIRISNIVLNLRNGRVLNKRAKAVRRTRGQPAVAGPGFATGNRE